MDHAVVEMATIAPKIGSHLVNTIFFTSIGLPSRQILPSSSTVKRAKSIRRTNFNQPARIDVQISELKAQLTEFRAEFQG